jgi:nitroimidazol reductase NimA-like FMN-containing flavoprotein (pyridoxamine 5'-phosphate oxidase superfamily)
MMRDAIPVSARALSTDGARLPLWNDVQARLDEAQFYWLATVRPDGRPHVMPVLAVWLDGALHFCAGPEPRKARNLADSSHCVISVDGDDLHLVVEGQATRIEDEVRLQRLADVYESKYGWEATVHGGAFYADGAPTAGPPPYEVYAVTPSRVFGLGTDESFGAARWELA